MTSGQMLHISNATLLGRPSTEGLGLALSCIDPYLAQTLVLSHLSFVVVKLPYSITQQTSVARGYERNGENVEEVHAPLRGSHSQPNKTQNTT